MLLTKITLKNYGVYRDENVFDFTCTPDKPVILIGGTNGSGKTTLFEAIMIGLYGMSYFDKKATKKSYEKFLANKIHRYIGSSAFTDHASIIVDFKFFHNNKVEEYSVDRTWRNEDGKIIEKLTIRKDNENLESVDESQWQAFIEELIPRGIVKLFFFDGEKIVKISEATNEEVEIKSSFDSLLGLDLVEQLHSDLKIHILRNLKDDSKKIQDEHNKLEKERDEYLENISHLEEKCAQKIEELNQIKKSIEEHETKISKIGGGYATKRIELQARKHTFKEKRIAVESKLRVLLNGLAPLCLIPKQLEEVRDQLLTDEIALKQQFEEDIVKEKIHELSSKLKSNEIWNEFSFDTSTKEKIISKITEILAKNDSEKNQLKSLFNFSLVESTNLINTISLANSQVFVDLEKETTPLYPINDELQKIDTALANAPTDDEIGPLVSKLNRLHEEQGIIKTEIDHIETRVAKNKYYLKYINSKLRNIIDDQFKNKDATKQIELARKVQKVLDEYVEKLKIKKLNMLENYLLDTIKKLMHKENFIEKVSIDNDSFEIILYGKDGVVIPKDLLSKGEQQMFATAVLWALAMTSGKPLPFMIDTPLARLDIEHRDNLVQSFYPYASHQVIIFSTDSEIDANNYRNLKPFISHSYAMNYIPSEGRTQKNEGYFWNEKGDRIIVV